MKRLFLLIASSALLLAAFTSCIPIANALLPSFHPQALGVKVDGGWLITATDKIAAFTISSNRAITKYEATSSCRKQFVSAQLYEPESNFSLVCKAPNTVKVFTEGGANTRVLDFYAIKH